MSERPVIYTSSPFQWRTVLFLPQFAFEKASQNEADAFIVDFQDSVPLGAKAHARESLHRALASGWLGDRPIIVRLNEAGCDDELKLDLDASVGISGVTALMPTMIEHADELEDLHVELGARERALGLREGHTKLLPLIETPAAVLRCDAIAHAARGRVIGLLLGHGDLFRLTSAEPESQTTLDYPRNAVVFAARAAGIAAFDTPYTRVSDAIGLEREAREAKRHGFDGKACIHKDQLATVARCMRPGADELKWARRVEDARRSGELTTLLRKLEHLPAHAARDTDGMALVDGQLVGPPHIKAAQRILQNEPPARRVSGRVGRVIAHRSEGALAPEGILENPYEMTITEGMRDLWAQCFYTHDAAQTSQRFAHAIGRCEDSAMPAPFLMALYLAVSMSDTHGAIYHLGFRDGRQLEAVAVGDTVRQRIRVKRVRNTSDGKRAVVSTLRELVRADGEVLFRIEKRELYRSQGQEFGQASPPLDVSAHPRGDAPMLEAVKRGLPALLETRSEWAGVLRPREHFEVGEVLLHSFARPLGVSANLALSTQFLVTHPIHLDHQRHDRGGTGIVVSGGLVIALICGAASRDISHVVWEELIAANNVRPVAPSETVGALSVVLDRSDVADAPELECLVIKTIGIKGLTPAFELQGTPIPEPLLVPEVGGGSRYDELCRTLGVEALEGRIVGEVLRRVVRMKPGR